MLDDVASGRAESCDDILLKGTDFEETRVNCPVVVSSTFVVTARCYRGEGCICDESVETPGAL